MCSAFNNFNNFTSVYTINVDGDVREVIVINDNEEDSEATTNLETDTEEATDTEDTGDTTDTTDTTNHVTIHQTSRGSQSPDTVVSRNKQN